MTLYPSTGCSLSSGCHLAIGVKRNLKASYVGRAQTNHGDEPMEQLTIGGLAKRAGVNRETVRYYERRRLLPSATRSMAGYRLFPDEALVRLKFIKHAKALGFSLNEIRELLTLRVNSIDACDRVRQRAEAKIADIERKIRSLAAMKDALSDLVAACSVCRRTKNCPILDSLGENGRFEQQTGGRNG